MHDSGSGAPTGTHGRVFSKMRGSADTWLNLLHHMSGSFWSQPRPNAVSPFHETDPDVFVVTGIPGVGLTKRGFVAISRACFNEVETMWTILNSSKNGPESICPLRRLHMYTALPCGLFLESRGEGYTPRYC